MHVIRDLRMKNIEIFKVREDIIKILEIFLSEFNYT